MYEFGSKLSFGGAGGQSKFFVASSGARAQLVWPFVLIQVVISQQSSIEKSYDF